MINAVEKVVGSDVVLIWLDEHIGQEPHCRNLKKEFESNTTMIYTFYEVEHCRQFLKTNRNKKLFCIIQGKLAQSIVPDIERYATSPVVYIFCFDMTHLTKWAQDYDSIMNGGFFTHEKDLLARLTSDLSEYAQLKSQEYSLKRAACDEWAQNLAESAKRFRYDQCTLPHRTDPYSPDPDGQQPSD